MAGLVSCLAGCQEGLQEWIILTAPLESWGGTYRELGFGGGPIGDYLGFYILQI